jgi:uncharacterized cupin superfamily protein
VSTVEARYVIERTDARGYDPFLIDGIQVGEYRRLTPASPPADILDAGFWQSEPATYDYFFASDEAFHVLEGVVVIELPDTGESLELRAGDVAYFKAGTRSVWTIKERFKKFVVVPA